MFLIRSILNYYYIIFLYRLFTSISHFNFLNQLLTSFFTSTNHFNFQDLTSTFQSASYIFLLQLITSTFKITLPHFIQLLTSFLLQLIISTFKIPFQLPKSSSFTSTTLFSFQDPISASYIFFNFN